ncbi:hypothetical protein ABW20_dc0102737 [Dactylellina cionopaga]|nr:hypothetical protein ABW20_dc0102737 [Dactylellina cionopaga]
MQLKSLLLSGLSCSLVHAHFTLRHPVPLGKSAAKQDNGPCGGYTLDQNSPITEFHVDGEAIAYSSSHPEVNVLFRVVKGNKADGNGLEWDQVYPIIGQYGSGDFCEPVVKAPRDLVGQTGILQVIQNAVDGMLYACASVKFVSGTLSSLPDTCKNGTGVAADFVSDPSLQALMGGSEPATSSSGITSAPTATNTPSSASSKRMSVLAGVFGVAVAVIFGGL